MTTCAACGRENPADAKFCNDCGAPLAATAPAREQRKVVTVLFCDVTGSTALGEAIDPEALRALLARYFERMKAIVESHGGTVEKFIGDAVMAVFGVPVLHEDDALRAVRAAAEMRDALPELGVNGRIGVNTGEVVTGTEERLATGDAVNVAARLEQAAAPGEVLLGEETLGLVRGSVEAEPVEPLALKGKLEPVPAYRLLSVGAAPERRASAPMVGRETELRRLRDAHAQAARNRSCQLFTVLGAAGVGKSRLAAEFLGTLDGTRVVRGRCLSYGEGITYWPVVEVVKQLDALPLDPGAAAALRSLLGDSGHPTSAQEIAWAFRKLLEEHAQEQPLVCVFDDLHWGEDAFLELVEHVADLSRDAPILLLCMARPELLERRPGWGGGKWNATTVLLEPLDSEETDRLLDALGGIEEGLRERIRQASEGNPLFLEEMLVLVRESGGDEIAVPPTIHALLVARLEQLEPAERNVLERGAVYDALPKATRAQLHERFAGWLERHGRDLVELDEILGHHLEQAARYRSELGLGGDDTARRAGAHLSAAGRAALLRGDAAAAASLLTRSAGLLLGDERRPALLCDLGDALALKGMFAESSATLTEAAELAAAAGDRHVRDRAKLLLAPLRAVTSEAGADSHLQDALTAATEIADAARDRGDDAVLATALALAGEYTFYLGQAAEAENVAALAYEVAVRADDRRIQDRILAWRAPAKAHGPASVEDGLAYCEELSRSPRIMLRAFGRLFHAELTAFTGDFDAARAEADAALTEVEDVGMLVLRGGGAGSRGRIEWLAGDDVAAEHALREGWELLGSLAETGYRSTVGGLLAEALLRQGRLQEAESILAEVVEMTQPDDIEPQVRRRLVRGGILARSGDFDGGIALTREAVELSARTDYVDVRTDALLALAAVLALAGRNADATDAVAEARVLFEQKGHVVGVRETSRLLDELGMPA